MGKRVHYYTSLKNALVWLMVLCLVGSAVTRIVFACLKGPGDTLEVWSQIVLPVAAALLYVCIVLFKGKEHLYRTAIPVWLIVLSYALRPYNISGNNQVLMLILLYTVLFFCGVLYGIVISGRVSKPWLLLAIFGVGTGINAWLIHINGPLSPAAQIFLPDLLLFFGCFIMTFAIRVHPRNEYHPTWGDRSDGRRIRTLPAMSQVSPYIMVGRNESSNLFAESFEITHIDRYIRQKRREGYTNFGIMHVMLATYCRAVCKYPALNRFLAGQKVYSRGDDIQFCLTVKKEMSVDAPDTVIKVHLTPRDTSIDVYNKLQKAVEEVKNTPLDSGMDNTAGALAMIPGVVLKFVVWLLKLLDYFGLIPKFLLEVSPFHGSVFFTSMGSLGIPPIYHHLYDFGNLPVFGAFGCKRRSLEVLEDGSIVQRKYIDCKFTLDERIVDGYYYAAFFKHYKRILAHPEILDNPPEEVLKDID